ncbi:hypothetical protein JSQ81_13395 [Sporosarcina sp. Marseille-Q4063]|uniref:hypothetical protein n=1 Tax=Sporosarcina sp. Marseille-Q4063 TaxID=2810514 RepID=UPI001BAFAC9E|nr:hypothetical protein [Sporosarcina sp. Marseille-Q4063]QUW20808.1 hypothetical protein JSQ81_13395 [Sporosarcina sp. Marseille-Q4063]
MKKLMLLILTVSLAALIVGCSLFVKEVDYQTIATDLNEKNMDKILNAVGRYGEINQYITISYNGMDIEDNSLHGIFDTKDKISYGVFSQWDVNNKIEGNYFYENDEFKVDNQNVTGEKMLFLSMHLQGIEKLIPEKYIYGLDEPPSVRYQLTESQFEEIINDDHDIQYDKFEAAKVLIQLREVGNSFEIKTITISAKLEREMEENIHKVLLSSRTDLLLTEENGNSQEAYKLQEDRFNTSNR